MLSAKINEANSLSLGAQWQENLDAKQSDAVIVFAVTTSTGESLHKKYMRPYSSFVGGPRLEHNSASD
jgi:hypothetical protein